MSDPECFRKLQDTTIADTHYSSEERTPALGLPGGGLPGGGRGRRSNDYYEDTMFESQTEMELPSVGSYVWSNLGFLFFGLFIGVALGVMGHLFYILHGNIPRPGTRGARNYTFSSDH